MRVIVPLSSPSIDDILRVGEFSLLPKNWINPIIGSQPKANIYQSTWIKSVVDQKLVYQAIKPSDGVFRMVEGTKVAWSVFAMDPSNLESPNSDSSLRFVWRRDGTPLVELNNSNQYRGSKSVLITEQQSTPEASGTYVCEISSAVGTTSTEELNIEVIKLDKHPKLYSNLLINGNAGSQLDGWVLDQDIISREFVSSLFLSNGFGSMPKLYELLSTKDGLRYNAGVEFAFSQDYSNTLYRSFQSWVNLGPDWRNIDPAWMHVKPSQAVDYPLEGWRRWAITGITPQIIDNEATYSGASFGGFFPAMQYIDQYNLNSEDSNTPVIGLLKESEDQRLSYFTRDKLKFTKYGGKATSQMTQTVDLTDLADLIDGNVFGVAHTTSQFFAYVGAGLTRYKIRAQVTGQGESSTQTFNWFVVDYDQFMARLEDDLSTSKLALVPGTPIEIIPLVEDITQVEIKYLNQQGQQISHDLIDGPNERDVFAIKDCTFLPIALYPIFEFFIANGNPIKIFGQTYTNTDALEPLFEESTPFPKPYPDAPAGDSPLNRFAGWEGDQGKLQRLQDVQAQFALTKLNWLENVNLTPIGYNVKLNRSNRSIRDYGAAGMFGVEKTRIIPRGTRSAQIIVRFTHTSDTILDNNPKAKKWSSQTIYLDTLGQSSNNGRQVIDYSYPRCGITKMKFLVVPNNFTASPTYPSYKLPPSNNTVVGYRKQQLTQNVHDSTNSELFPAFAIDTATNKVRLAIPLSPTETSPFLSDTEAQYLISQQQQAGLDQELESRGNLPEVGQVANTDIAEQSGRPLIR